MLRKSHTGYLSDYIAYTGVDTVYPQPSIRLPKSFKNYSNPSKSVLSLLEEFYNARYNLALNKLCLSPELLQVFFEKKPDAYKTLRKKGLSVDFWSWKPTKEVGESPKKEKKII